MARYIDPDNIPEGSIMVRNLHDRKPDPLRKKDPSNFGRFLDNHYTEQMHGKPWNVQMKAPDLYHPYF